MTPREIAASVVRKAAQRRQALEDDCKLTIARIRSGELHSGNLQFAQLAACIKIYGRDVTYDALREGTRRRNRAADAAVRKPFTTSKWVMFAVASAAAIVVVALITWPRHLEPPRVAVILAIADPAPGVPELHSRLAQALPQTNSKTVALMGQTSNLYQTFEQLRRATVVVRTGAGWASGVAVLSPEWILTTYSAVASAVQEKAAAGESAIVAIHFENQRIGSESSARIYRADPARDLALLKIESGTAAPAFVKLATKDSAECRIVGSEENADYFVRGLCEVVEHLTMPGDRARLARYSVQVDSDRIAGNLFLTDAQVSTGYVGAPVFDRAGDLIGITLSPAKSAKQAMALHLDWSEIRQFLSNLPLTPEPVPFDPRTAGLGDVERLATSRQSPAGQPCSTTLLERVRGPHQIYAETRYLILEPKPCPDPSVIAPAGLWGMPGAQRQDRFLFDVFVSIRTDRVIAVGFTNREGVVDEIRLGVPGDPQAGIVWNRSASGAWSVRQTDSGVPLIGSDRLTSAAATRLISLLGPLSAWREAPSLAKGNR